MRTAFLAPALFAVSALLAADFPRPYDSEKETAKPLPPEEAARSLTMPPGFQATVFAAEPEVMNPIAMAWDHRGRLWVAENFTYAERPKRFDLSLRDRVLIFEDTDNDGRADSRKVFTDSVQMLTSIEIGRGGVWLMCPPQVLFVPDADGDDVPDGEPQAVLDGFTVADANYHNYANGLRWGPDGWLYGRCGHSCPGLIGVPGAPDERRVPVKGGLWRFHPERKTAEALCYGTTNPWGHDWDGHGECFFINTVTGHLWHLIPGSHLKDSNPSPNPLIYDRLDTIADHYHFDTAVGAGKSIGASVDALGGGHAHIGMMIYQGGQWPESWNGKLLTLNMHGRRANVERLERRGTSFAGRHEPDVFRSGDPFFRGIDLSTGPDGSVFILDWSDTGECHESTGVHRSSGRIFKVSYGKPEKPDLSDLADITPAGIQRLLGNPNAWFHRQLAVRLNAGEPALSALKKSFADSADTVVRLRALWCLAAMDSPPPLLPVLADPDEHIRAWAVRLLADAWPIDLITGPRPGAAADGDQAASRQLVALAKGEPSGLVRLALASVLQRLPVEKREPLAAALVSHSEDAGDQQQPSMVWFGISPLAMSDPAALVRIAGKCEWPDLHRWTARSLSSRIEEDAGPLNELLKTKPGSEAVLAGMSEAFRGWRKAPQPELWPKFAASFTGKDDAIRELSALFGDGRALDEVKRIALDAKADLAARQAALKTLIEARPPDLRAVCEPLLDARFLNATAAKGLALFDDEAVAARLVKNWSRFSPGDRPAVMDVLASRPVFAKQMLAAMSAGRIARGELSAFHARQIRSSGDEEAARLLAAAWGELRDSPAEKRKIIAGMKAELDPASLRKADLATGRVLFQALCSSCHTLYGAGGKAGPDLTGSNRGNLDYLLENILDPSAVVSADHRMTVFTLKDGRIIAGIITAMSGRGFTVRTLTEEAVIAQADVAKQETSPLSMMPDGLIQALPIGQARSLIAYLMHPVQVPLPGGKL